MSQEYIEITEKTLDDAITLACQKLSVTSSRLEYEVIDEGKSGFFGIGARPARIRARVKEAAAEVKAAEPAPAAAAPVREEKPAAEKVEKTEKAEKKDRPAKAETVDKAAQEAAVKEPVREEKKQENRRAKAEKKQDRAETADKADAEEMPSAEPARKFSGRKNDRRRGGRNAGSRRGDRRDRQEKEAGPIQFLMGADVPQHQKKKEPVKAQLTPEQIEETKQKAERFLKDIFAAMDMEVEITQEYDEDEALLSIEMEGDDMGVLIGKRGQTLDSLQYLISLIVNKGVEGYIRVKADTEDYRDRRKRTLEQLAKRKATSVKRNRRPEALEPMNPYERRIVHSALQGDRYVTTYSEGEGEDRRVIITLKEG